MAALTVANASHGGYIKAREGDARGGTGTRVCAKQTLTASAMARLRAGGRHAGWGKGREEEGERTGLPKPRPWRAGAMATQQVARRRGGNGGELTSATARFECRKGRHERRGRRWYHGASTCTFGCKCEGLGAEGRCRGFKPLGRAVSDWAGDVGEGAAFVGHGSGAVVEGRSP